MINRVFVMSGDEQRRVTITPKQGTHTKVIAVVVGQKRSRPSLDLKISHQDPDAESDIVIRTLALDRSRIKVHGLLDIRKGAKRTKTYLKADALMLGDAANVDLVPSLEIDENDVRAGHGASVGRVDDEQLFYLTSRGIDRKRAEKMVAEGFLRSVFPFLTSRDQNKIRSVLNDAFAVA